MPTSTPQFDIHIQPGLTRDDISVTVTGEVMSGWNADLQKLFFGDANLKELFCTWLNHAGIKRADGYKPSAYWVDAGPSFDSYGWVLDFDAQGGTHLARWKKIEEPQFLLHPVNARVTKIAEEVVLVDHEFFDNRNADEPRTYTSSMSDTVEESTESGWEKSQTVGVEVQAGVEVGPVSGSVTMSYEQSWGTSGSVSKSESLGIETSVEAEVEPGKITLAAIVGKRGDLYIEVDYIATMQRTGHIGAGFYRKHNGYHQGSPLLICDDHYNWHNAKNVYIEADRFCAWQTNSYVRTAGVQKIQTRVFADGTAAAYSVTDDSDSAVDEATGSGSKKVVYDEATHSPPSQRLGYIREESA